MSDQKTMTLYHDGMYPDGKEFEVEHAKRILAIKDNGGIYKKENVDQAKRSTKIIRRVTGKRPTKSSDTA
jgi:hypothetical protein